MKRCNLISGFFLLLLAAAVNADTEIFAARSLRLQGVMPGDSDMEQLFEDPLPARIAEAGGKRIVQLANCRDYLSFRSSIVGSDTDNNYRVLRLQTVPCSALALLKLATTSRRTALPKDFMNYTSTQSYTAMLWPAISEDERRRLLQPGATLQNISGKSKLRKVDDDTLGLEAKNLGIHLKVLARGDFNRDGWEDVAFLWEAYAIKGSYTDARLIVLTRTKENAAFEELSLDSLLSGQAK